MDMWQALEQHSVADPRDECTRTSMHMGARVPTLNVGAGMRTNANKPLWHPARQHALEGCWGGIDIDVVRVGVNGLANPRQRRCRRML